MDYLASNFREEYLFTHLLYLAYQSVISDKESRVAVVALRQQDCEAVLFMRHWPEAEDAVWNWRWRSSLKTCFLWLVSSRQVLPPESSTGFKIIPQAETGCSEHEPVKDSGIDVVFLGISRYCSQMIRLFRFPSYTLNTQVSLLLRSDLSSALWFVISTGKLLSHSSL